MNDPVARKHVRINFDSLKPGFKVYLSKSMYICDILFSYAKPTANHMFGIKVGPNIGRISGEYVIGPLTTA